VSLGVVVIAAMIGASVHACGPVHRPDGGVGLLTANAPAPAFSARDQDGHERSLAEFHGRPVVLYFYPRDGTPGCTREACAFRDAWDRLAATGAQVIGVSSDDVASHARFAREHRLVFPLLADEGGAIARSYGVRRTFGLDARVTFVLGPDGRVVRVFANVDPAIHANEVIEVLRAIGAAAGPAA
jgi:peroxiredoxin Q/BCP